MGLDNPSIKFLCAAKALGADFSNVAMLGRQFLFPDAPTLKQCFSQFGIAEDAERFLKEHSFGEEFFKKMGARQVSSIDASDYEGATFLQDMNAPLREDLREKFSLVLDGGTLEHVFNVPQGLKNAMEMVKLGGHFIQVNVANNYMGHGFWQFSPELLYRVFSQDNGFEVELLVLHEQSPSGRWFLTADPEKVRSRVQLCNQWPTYILTLARRTKISPIFASPPQQSDYSSAWQAPKVAESPQRQVTGLRNWIPKALRRKLGRLWLNLHQARQKPFQEAYYKAISETDLMAGQIRAAS